MKTNPATPRSARPGAPATRRGGFTVMEMLVVLGIIAAVLSIGLPALRGLGQGNEMDDALRRLRSDLEQARQMAVSRHTTIAVVFVPPSVLGLVRANFATDEEWTQVKTLKGGICTHYAFLSMRQPGDQPGQATLKYLSEWRSLPQRTFIPEDALTGGPDVLPTYLLPFPAETNAPFALPYVAFDHQGRVVRLAGFGSETVAGVDAVVPVTRGAIQGARDVNGDLTAADVTIQEIPPGFSTNMPHLVIVEWLTGRARMERPEVQ